MKKKYITIAIIFVVLLTVDLITKSTFVGADYNVIPYLINFVYTENRGAGFSILEGQTGLLIALSLVMVVALVLYDIFTKKMHTLYNVSFALIITGAIGNVIDRIAFGYVRDFIQFDFWQAFPIFNVADICLTIGVVLLVVFILFFDKSDKEIQIKQNQNNIENNSK